MKKLKMVLIMASLLLVGCGKVEEISIEAPEDEVFGTGEAIDYEMPSEDEVMDRIIEEKGLENAIVLTDDLVITADLTDKIFLLCKSEGEKYAVYGFLSPEYGYKGILINNTINGEPNYNYFHDNWVIGSNLPEIIVLEADSIKLSFNQIIDGREVQQSVVLESFDTGTVSPRDSVDGSYLVSNAVEEK